MDEMGRRILTLEQFEVNEKGEVLIKDREIARALAEAKAKGLRPGEKGSGIAIALDTCDRARREEAPRASSRRVWGSIRRSGRRPCR